MHSSGINREGELRGQPANSGSPGKWLLKQSVCVCVCEYGDYYYHYDIMWYGIVY